jgi:hypothetical protein
MHQASTIDLCVAVADNADSCIYRNTFIFVQAVAGSKEERIPYREAEDMEASGIHGKVFLKGSERSILGPEHGQTFSLCESK